MEKSYFEKQREALVGEIAVVCPSSSLARNSSSPSSRLKTDYVCVCPLQSLEQVLQNINKLNRSLEGVIAV